MTDTTRLPDASEDRVIECPVCSNTMTKMESEGVTVDVCAGGCGGIWFDWFELARVDEAHESAGEKFLEVERDPALNPDLSKRIRCPRGHEIMMRHFHSVKRGVVVDECPRCAGYWLDAGELAGIRTEFATEEERKQASPGILRRTLRPRPGRGKSADHGGPQKSAKDRTRLPLHLPELLYSRQAGLGSVLEPLKRFSTLPAAACQHAPSGRLSARGARQGAAC